MFPSYQNDYEFILVDFEFRPIDSIEGNPIKVICMVSLNLKTGKYTKIWADDLYAMEEHPFPQNDKTIVVAYFASAEMNCFRALGWSWPEQILDLYAEFRCLSNGISLPFGKSLLGALQFFGLPAIKSDLKNEMRNLALRGGGYTPEEKTSLLDYCQSDVDALKELLTAMYVHLDIPRALLRGKYNIPLAIMETNGTPIDQGLYQELCKHWDEIKFELIQEIDKEFHVYVDGVFKESLFEEYVSQKRLNWPRHEHSGKLKLDEETFKYMSVANPCIRPLRNLRDSLAKLRLNALQVGADGRNRCLLSPFSSITGRNQPSTNKFVFGLSRWARGLIQPKQGMALAYIDWSQQEFGIAAAFSKDENMKAAYLSGDPYLAFAKQAGAVPMDATKKTHASVRHQYKECVLATQYGMGADALAARIKQPVIRARQLLALHRKVYSTFWKWSDNYYNHTATNNSVKTLYGWNLNIPRDLNPRSLRNFPMQANAAEMLRIACILIAEAGVQLCAPVHDAILIEAPEDEIEEKVQIAKDCMAQASKLLLGDFQLATEVEILKYPERLLDEDSKKFWDKVLGILERVKCNENLTPSCQNS